MAATLQDCLAVPTTMCEMLWECLQEFATGEAVCNEGSASPRAGTAAAAQQRQSCAPSEAARTELAGSVSSRSSASQGSECRWVLTPRNLSGLLIGCVCLSNNANGALQLYPGCKPDG